MRAVILALATASIFAVSTCAATGGQTQDCFGGLTPRLRAGGYSGSLDCQAIDVDITHVGDILSGSVKYEIYSLRYIQRHPAGDSRHGGQRILVFVLGSRYVGQYVLDTPPFLFPRVVGQVILFDLPADYGNEIRFDAGSPAETYINQNTLSLVK